MYFILKFIRNLFTIQSSELMMTLRRRIFISTSNFTIFAFNFVAIRGQQEFFNFTVIVIKSCIHADLLKSNNYFVSVFEQSPRKWRNSQFKNRHIHLSLHYTQSPLFRSLISWLCGHNIHVGISPT